MPLAPALLGVLVLAAAAAPAQEVLVSNFHTIRAPGGGYSIRENSWKAAGFVNDGQARELAAITVSMGAPLPGMIAELWSGDDEPTTYVASFGEGPLSVINTFIWEPLAPAVLEPNGTYWMLLAYPDGSPDFTNWFDTTDSSTVGPGSLVKPLFSPNDGATWQTLDGNINRRLRLVVEVPEPAGLAAAWAALVAVAARRQARSGAHPVAHRS